jgi:tetratricopeptide (TPR) repeat protein
MKSTWPYKRYLKILCCSFFFAYAGICVCQCPNKDFIQKQLRDADKLYPIKNENPLGELLRLQQQLKLCGAIHDSTYMFLLQKIGKFYFKQSDFINAVHITNQSIVVARECLKINPANSLPIVDGYYNLHYYFNVMGDEEKKYDAIDSCIAYSLKGNIGFDKTIPVLQDKTSRLFNKGEYSACITNAELGISLMQQYHGDNSVAYMILFTDNLVNSLIFSADISTAEKILDRQKSFLEQTNNSKYLGEVYSFLGSINRDKRRYPEAVTYFKKANRAFGMIKYNSGYAKSLMNLGKLYAIAFNNTNKGLNFCEEAIKYAEGEDSLIILMETGNIYVQKKLYDKAQYFFQQAFNVVQHGMDETSMLKNTFQFPGFNQLQDLSDLATGKGDAFLQQYYDTKDEDYLKKALAVYRKNDFFLAKIKTEHQLQINSSLVWKATARNLYEHALDACYVNNNTEDAFYFFEKSRATLLDDQIKEQQWTNDADIAKLAAVKRTIIELQRKINSLPSSSVDYLPIQHKLYNSSEELTFLSHKLKTDNPVFYQHYVDTSFINLVQLRQDILGNSKSLVEIFSGDSSVYVLTVTPVNKKVSSSELLYNLCCIGK